MDVKVIHCGLLPVLCRKCSDSVLSQIENTASKGMACVLQVWGCVVDVGCDVGVKVRGVWLHGV